VLGVVLDKVFDALQVVDTLEEEAEEAKEEPALSFRLLLSRADDGEEE